MIKIKIAILAFIPAISVDSMTEIAPVQNPVNNIVPTNGFFSSSDSDDTFGLIY